MSAGCDFFTIPTLTFQLLYVFVVLSHSRRRILHVNVTEHPDAEWTAQQLTEAFPGDAPVASVKEWLASRRPQRLAARSENLPIKIPITR